MSGFLYLFCSKKAQRIFFAEDK